MECQKKLIELDEAKIKLKNYDDEFSQLKNQEITVRNLEDKIKLNEIEYETKIKDIIKDERIKMKNEINKIMEQNNNDKNVLKNEIKTIQNENLILYFHFLMFQFHFLMIIFPDYISLILFLTYFQFHF